MRVHAKLLCLAATGLALTALPAHAQDGAAKASQLLAAAKQASGGPAWDAIASWHETGQITMEGRTGSYATTADMHQLGLGSSATLGTTTLAHGFDGRTPWSSDPRGAHTDSDPEAIAGAGEDAYVSAYGFFFPDRFPAQFDYAGPRQAAGASFDAVKVTPRGGSPFEVWIDQRTHLVTRFVESDGPQPDSTIMSDFGPAGGITAPHMIRQGNGDPRQEVVLKVATIDFPPADRSRFAPPAGAMPMPAQGPGPGPGQMHPDAQGPTSGR